MQAEVFVLSQPSGSDYIFVLVSLGGWWQGAGFVASQQAVAMALCLSMKSRGEQPAQPPLLVHLHHHSMLDPLLPVGPATV